MPFCKITQNVFFHDAVQIKHTDAENQIVLSWTWFNIQARNKTQVRQNRLGYLPSINAAATDLLMIYDILCESLQKYYGKMKKT